MRLIDDRGRLFGRVNLIDAAVIVGLVLLAFAVYSTYKATRPAPVPTLTSAEPGAAVAGMEARLTLHGRNLRPLLRLTIGPNTTDLFVADETLAQATIPGLTVGTYDLVLYDQGQEMSRLPKALAVTTPVMPTTDVQAVGAFTLLDAPMATMFAVGSSFPGGETPVVQVLATKPPRPAIRRLRIDGELVTTPAPNKVEVPAVIRLRCTTLGDNCVVGDTLLARGVSILVPVTGGSVAFRVDDVRSAIADPIFPAEPARAR